jgi:hypothetical protein
MNDKTQQSTNYLGLKPNYDVRNLIRDAIKLSPDKLVRTQQRGWWPRLIFAALTVYVASLLNTPKESK